MAFFAGVVRFFWPQRRRGHREKPSRGIYIAGVSAKRPYRSLLLKNLHYFLGFTESTEIFGGRATGSPLRDSRGLWMGAEAFPKPTEAIRVRDR